MHEMQIGEMEGLLVVAGGWARARLRGVATLRSPGQRIVGTAVQVVQDVQDVQVVQTYPPSRASSHCYCKAGRETLGRGG